MIRAGRMRHVIDIQVRSTTQDAAGEQEDIWNLHARRRAALEVMPGREIWTSQQRDGRVPTVFRLRYLADVTPAMRVVFDDRVFNIISATDPDGLQSELLLTTEELVGEAA